MTIPNLLSIFRIILVPVFIFTVMSGAPKAFLYGMIIFLVAGVTDVLDGKIARRFNCTSVLGKVLDPVADKMMVASALVCAAMKDVIPWLLPIIYISKEALQCTLGIFLYKKLNDMIPSNILGKLTTVFFYLTIVLLFLVPSLPEIVKHSMIIICIALLCGTVIFYTRIGIKAVRAKSKEKKV